MLGLVMSIHQGIKGGIRKNTYERWEMPVPWCSRRKLYFIISN